MEWTIVGGTPLALPAWNRGIVVGGIYGALWLAGLFAYAVSTGIAFSGGADVGLALACGAAAGVVVGFSNGESTAGWRSELRNNMRDALVCGLWLYVWTLVLLLGTGHVAHEGRGVLVAGAVLGGVLLGAVLGEPLLRAIAKIPVRGRYPFLWVARVTAGIVDDDTRFVVRVLCMTLMAGLLAVALSVALALFLFALAMMLIAAIFFNDDRPSSRSGRPPQRPRGPAPTRRHASLLFPRGGSIHHDAGDWIFLDQEGFRTGTVVRQGRDVVVDDMANGLSFDDTMRLRWDGVSVGFNLVGQPDGGYKIWLDGEPSRYGLDADGRAYRSTSDGDFVVGLRIDNAGVLTEV